MSSNILMASHIPLFPGHFNGSNMLHVERWAHGWWRRSNPFWEWPEEVLSWNEPQGPYGSWDQPLLFARNPEFTTSPTLLSTVMLIPFLWTVVWTNSSLVFKNILVVNQDGPPHKKTYTEILMIPLLLDHEFINFWHFVFLFHHLVLLEKKNDCIIFIPSFQLPN